MSEHISADEAHRLREAATPGPWFRGDQYTVMANDPEGRGFRICTSAQSNAALIAAAPALAASVERLEADNQRLRAALDDLEVQAAEMEAECLKPPCQHAWGIRVAIERMRAAALSVEGDTP